MKITKETTAAEILKLIAEIQEDPTTTQETLYWLLIELKNLYLMRSMISQNFQETADKAANGPEFMREYFEGQANAYKFVLNAFDTFTNNTLK